MNDDPRKTKPNWGSIVSLVIFLLFVVGRPLANFALQIFNGGNIPFPSSISFPWQGLLPLAVGIGALLVGAVVIARILRVGDSASRSTMQPSFPLPRYDTTVPQPPRFEPLIKPHLLLLGVIGLLVLGAIGFYILQFGI